MGGTMWATSVPGEGSTFYFTFVTGGSVDLETIEPAPALQENRSSLRVLLAEDNLVNQGVAVHMLERLGHRVQVAANGQEALDAVAQARYDVVLLDVNMPVMDGLEAARHLGARYKPEERPRLIAMTANALVGDRERCIDAGMDDYLSKPVRIDQLQAILSGVMPFPVATEENAQDDLRQSVLAHIKVFAGNNTDFALEITEAFILSATQFMAEADEAIAQEDQAHLLLVVHTLKSNAAYLGLADLEHLCQETETALRQSHLQNPAPRLQQIRQAFTRATPILKAVMADLHSQQAPVEKTLAESEYS
jgi:CheY-like chemotaxis protein